MPRTTLAAVSALLVLLAGCSTLDVATVPPELRSPQGLTHPLLVVYDPHAVLGFGHTGLILRDTDGTGWVRFDQYASAEVAYDDRLDDGSAHWWEVVTARLPSIAGTTREIVMRRQARHVGSLVAAWEVVVPVPLEGLSLPAIRAAARARWRTARRLEQPQARRYSLLGNSCQHFLRDVLQAGGDIHVHVYPAPFVKALLARYREAPQSSAGGS